LVVFFSPSRRISLSSSSSSLAEQPFWAIVFLRRFCQTSSDFHFSGFRTNNFFTGKVVSLASSPQHGGPGPCISVPQWQGRPGTGFPFRRLLRFAWLRWWYSNPPPHRGNIIMVPWNRPWLVPSTSLPIN
jgi:hypothetical protein